MGEVGDVYEEYRKKCYKRFPLATAFHTDQDRSPMAFWSNSYKTLNETHENCVSNWLGSLLDVRSKMYFLILLKSFFLFVIIGLYYYRLI